MHCTTGTTFQHAFRTAVFRFFLLYLLADLYAVKDRALPAADSLTTLGHKVLLPPSAPYCHVRASS